MKVIILATIILSATVAVFPAIKSLLYIKTIADSFDAFTHSFLGGLLGGFVGTIIGSVLG